MQPTRVISLGFIFASLAVGSAHADVGDQTGKILPNDGAAFDQFGCSAAVSGTTAIVGADRDSDNGASSGAAYLFDTVTGLQIAKLLPTDGASNDFFGISVAISGTTAIVGAFADDDNGSASGSAYLFDTVTGLQIAKLLPTDGTAGDQFGNAVAISATRALVGAFADDDNGSNSGSAYLFDTTSGQQIAKFVASDGAASDQFGLAVGISTTAVVIGAPFDDDNGDASGSAYLFDPTTELLIAKLLPGDGVVGAEFGISAAASDSTVVVGADLDDDNGIGSGSAYIFDALSGLQDAKLLPSDGAIGDGFGSSIAISDTTAVIGAQRDGDNGIFSGSAYAFDTGSQTQLAKLLPSDGFGGDQFGHAVGVSGATAVVGSFADDDNGTNSGSAYTFDATNIYVQASTTVRNGSGINALIFTKVTDPVLGSNWDTDLDASAHAPAVAVLLVLEQPSSGTILPGGELLVDLTSTLAFADSLSHSGGIVSFSEPVPSDNAFFGFTASAQAAVLGAPGYELSNALDLVLGF